MTTSKQKEQAGNSEPVYLKIYKGKDLGFSVSTVGYGDYLFDYFIDPVSDRSVLYGIEAVNGADILNKEELQIQIHEFGIDNDADIDDALEAVENYTLDQDGEPLAESSGEDK